ncbi:MAG: PDZ domain-containing protein [Candidatus Cloacimonetes bacterium]|nr:PDZ domain-containing protein [Candidatus Cloacimonadota bacterium]
MKQLILVVVLGVVLGSFLFAENKIVIKKDVDGSVVTVEGGDLEDIEKEMKNVKIQIHSDMKDLDLSGNESPDRAYFGIFVEEMTFTKAQDLGYKDNIGVLISGVVQNSPAWVHRLQEDDILVQIDNKKVLNNKEFNKILASLRAGDKIVLRVFRGGEYLNVNFEVGSKNGIVSLTGEKAKSKLSAGYGGGTWIPMFFQTDMEDVNNMLEQLGFNKQNEDGQILYGGGGKLPIGKGYFLGGQIVFHEDAQEKAALDNTGANIGTKWARYSNLMGGVTLDKRIPITKNIITSVGFLLGGASHTIELTHTDKNFTWDQINQDTNFHNFRLGKGYAIVSPRAEVMVRLLSWLALRAEGGYTYGYAPNEGWKISGIKEEAINVSKSPNTEYQGFHVTIGPWFGF